MRLKKDKAAREKKKLQPARNSSRWDHRQKQQGVDECGKLAGCLMDCRRAHSRITSLDSPLSTLSLSLSLSLSQDYNCSGGGSQKTVMEKSGGLCGDCSDSYNNRLLLCCPHHHVWPWCSLHNACQIRLSPQLPGLLTPSPNPLFVSQFLEFTSL
jgi:hypothetical protein